LFRHQFKLGKWATEGVITGPRVVADFGSIDENETKSIREAVLSCILAAPGEEYDGSINYTSESNSENSSINSTIHF